jgi:hypothetical protein
VGLPFKEDEIETYVREMEVCLFQLIDRISSTQLGHDREKSLEYQEHLLPTKHTSDENFRDVALYENWKQWSPPVSPVEVVQSPVAVVQSPNTPTDNKGKERKARAKTKKKANIARVLPSSKRGKPKDDSLYADSAQVETHSNPHGLLKKKCGVVVEEARAQGEAKSQLLHQVDLPCMEHLSQMLPIFANRFGEATSEESKDEVSWLVFRYLNGQAPNPIIDNAIQMIRKGLDQCYNGKVITELREKDILHGHYCKSYVHYTENRKAEYRNADTAEKKKILERMYFELRDNEFRFVAQKGDGKDCVFYEMDYDSAIIRLRNRLQRANENEKKKKTKIEEVNVLETFENRTRSSD